uniref:(northern house mosquito) hypothetical protein n=1 Tax=Culex pipiens TaxID=7175 RepID=A0A8D8PGZ1_CULPI
MLLHIPRWRHPFSALRAPTVKLQFFSLGQKVENYCFPQVFPLKCQSLNRRRNLARSGHPIGHPKLQSDLKHRLNIYRYATPLLGLATLPPRQNYTWWQFTGTNLPFGNV